MGIRLRKKKVKKKRIQNDSTKKKKISITYYMCLLQYIIRKPIKHFIRIFIS